MAKHLSTNLLPEEVPFADFPRLKARLEAEGQSHVLSFWNELDDIGRKRLLQDIASVDFELLQALREGKGVYQTPSDDWLSTATLPEVILLGKGTREISPDEAHEAGWASLCRGEVAIILVAGGRGTRLGFPYPKGIYPIGPISGISLFQLHAEKIRALSSRIAQALPLCIMTSPVTELQTRAFFTANAYFGLDPQQVYFFRQGTMPAVEAGTGRLLLAAKDRLVLSPDGHGGMVAALRNSGLLQRLKDRGVKRLFYFQVDNPLVNICCPEFLGYHIRSGASMSAQVIVKKTPQDRLGNVVQLGDRLFVIEYSDLRPSLSCRLAPDGGLLFRWGSIAVHVFEMDFLEKALDLANALPWHIARKKIGYVDSVGNFVRPKEPNAIQYERFVFDLMPQAEQVAVVAVPEETHFAPLKNASGDPAGDTPETVRAALGRLWSRWLTAAGASVARDVTVEISPLYALDEKELAMKIPPGSTFNESCYLRST